jgi:AcrR family transcriptional regulator
MRPALKQARRGAMRAAVHDAAERVFAQRGYEGAHVQEMADSAGISTATLYALCGTKEDLWAEVHRVRGRALLDAAMAATGGASSAWDALRRGVRAYAEHLTARPDYLRLHLLESQPWAMKPRFTSDEQARLWREGLELSVEVFRGAIAEGACIPETPSLLARLMIAAHQVYLGEWVEDGMKEPRDILIARMMGHLDRTFATRSDSDSPAPSESPARRPTPRRTPARRPARR